MHFPSAFHLPQAVGLTSEIPNEVPYSMYGYDVGLHEWVYKDKHIYHNEESKRFPDLPLLDGLTPGQSVGLLITLKGQLYLYLDGEHCCEIAIGLPVNTPLWGVADVYGPCTKINSAIMSGESSGVVISPAQCVGEE